MRLAALIAGLALLASCATPPSKIQSAYVSPFQYSAYTCDQIDNEIIAVDTRADALARRLHRRASYDAQRMGVGLLIAWPALLFLSGGDGPQATEYAQLKGQKDALLVARNGCAERSRASGSSRGEIPGTVHLGSVTLVPAATPSGQCIIAADNYIGTGAGNMPAITTATPRCDQVPIK